MSKSALNDAYIALRNLLTGRVLSPATREQASRAVEELHKEALTKTLLNINPEASDNDNSSAA